MMRCGPLTAFLSASRVPQPEVFCVSTATTGSAGNYNRYKITAIALGKN